MPTESDRIAAVVRAVRAATPLEPAVGIVLGSGLGEVAADIGTATVLPFAALPGVPKPTVEGHGAELVLGRFGEVPVAILRGRVHLYEGHSAADAVFPVRVLVGLGAETILLTNAAGGLRSSFEPGDLGVIVDHLNLTGRNPLVGPVDERLGPRFPAMTDVYDPSLVVVAMAAAEASGIVAHRVVYAQVLGPSYETAAEVRSLAMQGADVVGMSTAIEAVAARAMGARVAGLSCITNRAAGLAGASQSHEDVQRVAARSAAGMRVLVRAVVEASA